VSESPLAAGALTIGTTVGNYKILEKIGEGGMGAVYLAAHPLLGRKAAIKVLLPEHSKKADLVNRFFNEAKTAASLRHPALVEVFDFGFLPDGSGYIVMDYLEGESLAARLERVAPLAPEVAAEIARQMAAGVAAAHGQGIVHRDLKPDNVFLVPDPEQPDRERVRILDFGIAKLVLPSGTGSKGATSTGMLLGTPLFMAPEQCRGAGQVDHRADIYSVGCILYMMLVGRPPFDHEGVGEILAAHLHEPVVPPRNIDPTVPEPLQAIVMRALAKKPEDRQQSMAELAAELQGFLTLAGEPAGDRPRGSSLVPVPRGSAPRTGVPIQRTELAAGGVPPPQPPPRRAPSAAEISDVSSVPAASPGPAPAVRGGGVGAALWVLLTLVLLGGGAGGALWWMKGRSRPAPRAASAPFKPARPVVVSEAHPPAARATAAPPSAAADEPPPPAAQAVDAAAVATGEGAAPAGAPETPPNEGEGAAAPAAGTEDGTPPAGAAERPRKPRPPAERRPAAGARAFARAMEHRQRGEEDLAMYAFQEALSLGLDADDRLEAERNYVNIKRKFGFLEVTCGDRGIEILVDGRLAGRTPLARPLLVRPGAHKVELSGSGYRPLRLRVDVAPTQTVGVKCRQ
jgi:serine/threonine-protein kinase